MAKFGARGNFPGSLTFCLSKRHNYKNLDGISDTGMETTLNTDRSGDPPFEDSMIAAVVDDF